MGKIVVVAFLVICALGLVGYAQNGFSTACKDGMHNYTYGNSIACCHSDPNKNGGQCK